MFPSIMKYIWALLGDVATQKYRCCKDSVLFNCSIVLKYNNSPQYVPDDGRWASVSARGWWVVFLLYLQCSFYGVRFLRLFWRRTCIFDFEIWFWNIHFKKNCFFLKYDFVECIVGEARKLQPMDSISNI